MESGKNLTFVFFGCSWTAGKHINLHPGQDRFKFDYAEDAIVANEKSYRALISKHFAANAINFSEGGSSNDRQFRLASEYFIGPRPGNSFTLSRHIEQYKKIRDSSWPTVEEFSKDRCLPGHVIDEISTVHFHNDEFEEYREDTSSSKYVLWFLTSTARKEFYNSVKKTYCNEMLHIAKSNLVKEYATNYYNHDREIEYMSQQMVLWNEYFKSKGIKNLWIDTFNHHDYPITIKNKLSFGNKWSDIMSNLCITNGFHPTEVETHLSGWVADEPRSKYLQDLNLLNQATLHPTILGHQKIANMLIPLIEQHFQLNKESE